MAGEKCESWVRTPILEGRILPSPLSSIVFPTQIGDLPEMITIYATPE